MRQKRLNWLHGSNSRSVLFTQFINCGNVKLDFHRYIYSKGFLHRKLVQSEIINGEFRMYQIKYLLLLETININSVFVAFNVSRLDTSHLFSFSRSWDRLDCVRDVGVISIHSWYAIKGAP